MSPAGQGFGKGPNWQPCPPLLDRETLDRRFEEDMRARVHAERMRAIFASQAAGKHPAPKRAPITSCPWPRDMGMEARDDAGEASDGFDYAHAAAADFDAVCANLTGIAVPDEVWAKGRERRAAQDATSIELAKAIDSTGRFPSPYYRGERDPSRCTVIDIMTGETLPMPSVKRSNMLPSIAKAARAKMLRDIEHFLGCHPMNGRKAGMFTITNGPRVPIHAVTLREDVKDFHRWLSKMAAHPNFKRWGLRMEWRASEFGSPQWDPETGQMTLHLHAHCLVTTPEHMSIRQRRRMRKKLWRVFKVHWDDAGDIVNAREFVKYPVKDADLVTILREGGPGVLTDLCAAIRGMHIVQPMGELRRVRSERKAIARRIYALARADGRTLEELGDINAGKRPLTPRSKQREAYKRACKANALANAKAKAMADNAPRDASEAGDNAPVDDDDGGGRDRSSDPDRGRANPPKNRVIALLPPAPYGSTVCAPGVVVWGFDGNVQAVLSQPRVAALIARHRAAFEAGREAVALIRACADAQTRAPRAASESSQRSDNCPGPDLAGRRPRPPDGGWSTEMLLEFAQ